VDESETAVALLISIWSRRRWWYIGVILVRERGTSGQAGCRVSISHLVIPSS